MLASRVTPLAQMTSNVCLVLWLLGGAGPLAVQAGTNVSTVVWTDTFSDSRRIGALDKVVRLEGGHLELARAIPSAPEAYLPHAAAVTQIEAVVNGTLYSVPFPQDAGTVELWVRGDISSQVNKGLVDNWSDARNHIFLRTYTASAGQPNMQLAFQKSGSSYLFVRTFNLPDNVYNLVAFTWNCTNQQAGVFVNGQMISTGAITDVTWRPSGQEFRLGSGFVGTITNARILSVALTASEIQDDFSRRYELAGQVVSEPIAPFLLEKWLSVEWTATNTPETAVLTQVEYRNGADWLLVGDTDLPGNATGFSVSPVDVSGLNAAKYAVIRLKASLQTTTHTATPGLLDWSVHMQIVGHPRVYVRPSDIPALQAKIALPEFQPLWLTISNNTANTPANGGPICSAFVYLMTGDEVLGRRAITNMLPTLKTTVDARTFSMPMQQCACIYDWCYPLLTTMEKQEFRTEFERIANLDSPFYPADPNANAVVGHSTEGWLLTAQLPAGAATYEENPLMFDAGAALFFDRFVPVRNFYYPGHAHHQGDSYGGDRFTYDLAASWLFRKLGYGDVLSREQRYAPYHIIYNWRPDGQQMRRGDTYDHNGKSGRKKLCFTLSGTYYNDPYLLTMADDPYFNSMSSFEAILGLIFREPGLPKSPLASLPRTKYFGAPIGEMVARTGWTMGTNSADTVVQMRIGGTFFGNHQRRDCGTFQIYHRGALAISSGLYQGYDALGQPSEYGSDHWTHYYHQTLSHNGLLIYDPAEPLPGSARTSNDGGQLVPNGGADHPASLDVLLSNGYHVADVTSAAFGPDAVTPEYSYIAGDITAAYSDKVNLVTRSMVTFNTADTNHPCVLVVFDRVVSSNASFKKTWLLHSMQQPAIQSNTITILRNQGSYRGKLVVESLLPANPVITNIGGSGREFWVEPMNTNFYVYSLAAEAELGAWRVEVSPSSLERTNYFFHTLSVMDKNVAQGPVVDLIDSGDTVGLAVLDRAVLFRRPADLATNAMFTINRPGTWKMLVTDLAPGWWSVTRDETPVLTEARVSIEEHTLYFVGTNGSYTMRRVTADTDGDGMPDDWEVLNGLEPGNRLDAAGDADGDGMNNLAEYIAGTIPTNAADVLKFTGAMSASATGMVLRWSSVAGKWYAIQTSTNLLVGFDGWAKTNILATPTINTQTVTVDEAESRFYRITVE